jgi:aconitate hydratase
MPTFFEYPYKQLIPLPEIRDTKVLVLLGDSVTTDHISSTGSIPDGSYSTSWVRFHGVEKDDLNTYGSWSGNHEVMIRGTLRNIVHHSSNPATPWINRSIPIIPHPTPNFNIP